jgi:CRP-like cAMP-binding protein
MSFESFQVFKEFEQEYIELLKPLFEKFTCPVGTKIIAQGMPADYLYLLESGRVEISFKPYDAESITITHVEAGGIFGWTALIGGPQYTSSGVAVESVEAVRVRGSDLRKLCEGHPEAGKIILDRLAGAVSTRWTNSHEQVKSILESGLNV